MVITILISIFIICWQLPALINQKQKKEIIVFLLIWSFSSLYTILNSRGINIFNPFHLIIYFFEKWKITF